jgi:hypothetical protein
MSHINPISKLYVIYVPDIMAISMGHQGTVPLLKTFHGGFVGLFGMKQGLASPP